MKIAEIVVLDADGVVIRTGQGNGGVVTVLQQDLPAGATIVTRNINVPSAEKLADGDEMPRPREKWGKQGGRMVMLEAAPDPDKLRKSE